MELTTKDLVLKYRNHLIDINNEISNKYIEDMSKFNLDIFTSIIVKICNNEIDPNKSKGDIWEIFAEIFITYFKDDFFDYEQYSKYNKSDYGIDAIAVNMNKDKTIFQHKFRSETSYKNNIDIMIKYEDIAKTFTQSVLHEKYTPLKNNTIVLFTNVKDCLISKHIYAAFGNIVKIINYKNIDERIRNKHFWEHFEKTLNETRYF